jgi:pimeloyl-ACP methyl ester carboxylesterase
MSALAVLQVAVPATAGTQHPVRTGCSVTGDGAPVVLLHASLASKSQWTPLVERLAARYRTIAVDLAGYGDNAMPVAAPFTLDDEVRIVAAHVDNTAGPGARVHVVGHSYGGAVALRYAQRHGHRVASLSLYEPVAFGVLDGADPALAEFARQVDIVVQRIAMHRYHDAAQAFVDFWGGDGSYHALPLPAQTHLARRIPKVPLDFAAARGAPSGEACRAIDVPTLLLGGTRSPGVSQQIVSALSRRLRRCRTGWIDGGHMAPVNDAPRVNRLIEAFVDACVGSAAAATPARVAPRTFPARGV